MTNWAFGGLSSSLCNDHKDSYTLLKEAPIGTLAPAIMGGSWYKTERGWKWGNPETTGGTFPRPGGDWNGKLVYPEVKNG